MAQSHLKVTRADYWKVGPVYVLKWIVLVLLAAAALAVLMIFGLPSFPALSRDPPAYRWDDEELGKVTGLVRVLDSAGRKRYEGTVEAGSYTGRGKVYDSRGDLVYDGPLEDGVYQGEDARVYRDKKLVYVGEMAQNLYEGQGRRTDPVSGVVSTGQFSRGVLEGEGRQYRGDGSLLREGTFSGDLLNGQGREYGNREVLLREGEFSQGLLHGEGVQYTSAGKRWYEGRFRRGVWCGQGKLYDSLSGALAYEGEFSEGKASGWGKIYHPSGQMLYEGTVYDGKPRAEAFLGLSLAEVEGSFSEHWLLYTDGETTAFVYPYFRLMFVTGVPVELVPDSPEPAAVPAMPSEAASPAAAASGPPLEPETAGGDAAPSAAPSGRALDPDTVKGDLVICEVLSWRDPLPGPVHPRQEDQSAGTHPYGWREWFAAHALGAGVKGAKVEQTGPFVYEFTPRKGEPSQVEEYTASGSGVRVTAVWSEGKEGPLFYESAVRENEG